MRRIRSTAVSKTFSSNFPSRTACAICLSVSPPEAGISKSKPASKPATRRNLLTATGGITANVAGWTVNDADGNVVRKARINLDGTNLTLVLDAGTVIIFK